MKALINEAKQYIQRDIQSKHIDIVDYRLLVNNTVESGAFFFGSIIIAEI